MKGKLIVGFTVAILVFGNVRGFIVNCFGRFHFSETCCIDIEEVFGEWNGLARKIRNDSERRDWAV